MPPTVILDTPHARVQLHLDKKVVHHEFKSFIQGDDFKAVLNAGADAMAKHRFTKWLSDDRKNAALPVADQEWATKTWYPRVLKLGWKHWALVMPEMVIGQMNMQKFVKDFASGGLTVKVFSKPEEALAWLASV